MTDEVKDMKREMKLNVDPSIHKSTYSLATARRQNVWFVTHVLTGLCSTRELQEVLKILADAVEYCGSQIMTQKMANITYWEESLEMAVP